MSTHASRRALLWALLCGLLLGLLGMHHLSANGAAGTHATTASSSTTTSAAAHSEDSHRSDCCTPRTSIGSEVAEGGHGSDSHNLMHLCLAVLCAITALTGAVLIFRGSKHLQEPGTGRFPAQASPHRPARARAGPDLLSSICVLRL
ncbi:DUF6153 family protein [Saccharopolyspora tripterygii]